MPNETLTQALKEAYASSPSDKILLHTLEFRHSQFIDEFEAPTAIRVVRDFADFTGVSLEADAPLDPPPATVNFIGYAFDLSLPPISEEGRPEIVITIDNVSAEILKNMDRAIVTTEKILVTYRPYLSDDKTGPQMIPPLEMEIYNVTADIFKVEARATFSDFTNKPFPNETYTFTNFPGLSR